MSPQRYSELRALFVSVRRAPADQRAELLRRMDGSDPDLRAELESLLRNADAEGFLEAPLVADAVSSCLGAAPVPERFGKYRISRLLAEGGMGTVYEAEQSEPIRRRVALKVLRHGMYNHEAVARFKLESEALLHLDHPGISRLLDIGETPEGRPYFVMEYVDGEPIHLFVRRRHMPLREVLNLFVALCEIVQRAHQQCIIHRDLKPSNVLVVAEGPNLRPVVIDFGLAKALGPQTLTAESAHTTVGRILGTPEYMSPEQADNPAAAADTRSDVYSLGAVLYELLTGGPPFDPERLRSVGFAEMQRILREEEPPPVCLRACTPTPPKGPVSIRRAARELDCVVMKALAKDRTQRYGSVAALADDLGRLLAGAPVEAAPPTLWYRASKLARRHRAIVALAALLLLTLTGGLVLATTLYLRAGRAEEEQRAARGAAETASAEARQQADVAQQNETLARRLAYRLALVGAESLVRANDVYGARRQLELAPAEHRNWEWRHLWGRLDQSCRTMHGHAQPVRAVAFRPDGRSLASGSGYGGEDASVRLWEIPSGVRLAAGFRHIGAVTTLAFSGDGKYLASGGEDGWALVWDATTLQTAPVPQRHFDTTGPRVQAITIDSSQSLLVAGNGIGLERWDLNSGAREVVLSKVSLGPTGCGSATEHWLAVIHHDRRASLWSLTTREKVADLERPGAAWRTAAISPDERWIALGAQDAAIEVWSLETLQPVTTLRGHDNEPRSLAFNRDGTMLASGSADRTLRVWTIPGGTCVARLRGHEQQVSAVCFSPDSRYVASGSYDRTVKLWDMRSGEDLRVLGGHTRMIKGVRFAPRGDRLATCATDGTVRLWDVASGQILWNCIPHAGGSLHKVEFSPDGTHLAVCGDTTTALIDAGTGVVRHAFGVPGEPAFTLGFSPDGRRLVTARVNVRVWDTDTAQEQLFLPAHPLWTKCATFSPDGTRLLTAGYRDRRGGGISLVELWDSTTGEQLASTGFGTQIDDACFSPNGKWIAAVGENRGFILDAAGALIHELECELDRNFNAVTFSPDSTRLVAGQTDGAIVIWDPTDAKPLLSLAGHHSAIQGIAFSPDGRYLATCGGDHDALDCNVRIWDGALRP